MSTTHTSHLSPSQLHTAGTITITGNTFAVKDQIKAAGGRWDSTRKVWTIKNTGTMSERQRISNLTLAIRSHCDFVTSW